MYRNNNINEPPISADTKNTNTNVALATGRSTPSRGGQGSAVPSSGASILSASNISTTSSPSVRSTATAYATTSRPIIRSNMMNLNPPTILNTSAGLNAATATATPTLVTATAAATGAEPPIPQMIQRALGDRSYEKRKNAALEIETIVRNLVMGSSNSNPLIMNDSSLNNHQSQTKVLRIISQLSKDFCTSMNANYRKGGLIGIAAIAIGLMQNAHIYLEHLLKPVLLCFDDPESRVRYYACESLYNIIKVTRTYILKYFNQIFDGLCKLFADVDLNVKNGANLLDRCVYTKAAAFHTIFTAFSFCCEQMLV